MIKISNKLTWETAIEHYLHTLSRAKSPQKAKDIASGEIRRLAREMDNLNGQELK